MHARGGRPRGPHSIKSGVPNDEGRTRKEVRQVQASLLQKSHDRVWLKRDQRWRREQLRTRERERRGHNRQIHRAEQSGNIKEFLRGCTRGRLAGHPGRHRRSKQDSMMSQIGGVNKGEPKLRVRRSEPTNARQGSAATRTPAFSSVQLRIAKRRFSIVISFPRSQATISDAGVLRSDGVEKSVS